MDLNEIRKGLPDKPGIYIYKNKNNDIIYIGKAISLKKRVAQYFQSSRNRDSKVSALVSHIADIEYILTDSEVEALILESNLIKEHQPKYNILLRDDKSFPFIKVTCGEPYPRVVKVRRVEKDKGKYFGPYTNVKSMDNIIQLLNDIYPLKKCTMIRFPKQWKPCLNYHIGRCLGVCVYPEHKQAYEEMVSDVLEFLNNRDKKIVTGLKEKMDQCAQTYEFEKAAEYRDLIHSITILGEKQKMVLSSEKDSDLIVGAQGIKGFHFMIFFIRKGRLLGQETLEIKGSDGYDKSEAISVFLKQYYTPYSYIPDEIMIQRELEEAAVIQDWLSQLKGKRVHLLVPKKGEKKALLDLSVKNLVSMTSILEDRIKKKEKKGESSLLAIKELLGLEVFPYRIEAYDISNTSGVDSVGSMVVFEEGMKKKADYRKFKIKTIEGPNDYASMQEMIFRRMKRLTTDKNQGFGKKPNLILIDGGKGHVNAVETVIKAFGETIDVVGMVKDDHHNTRGLIYKNQEWDLKKQMDSYRFIYEIQEEAHHFAITYHRSLRKKNLEKSVLEEIPGIGAKRKQALLKHFGSVEKIKQATLDQLVEVEGMNEKAGKEILSFFALKK